MNVRHTTYGDLARIMKIYGFARGQMAKNGNPTQWIGYPTEEIILHDIKSGNSYVIEQNGRICGVFTFIIGVDSTYINIDGKWLNDEPYGTIHRIASNGTEKGILCECLRFCAKLIDNIRIDTHSDNKIMQHLLSKNGFTECGIIYVRDGSPRIAYQKNFNAREEKYG